MVVWAHVPNIYHVDELQKVVIVAVIIALGIVTVGEYMEFMEFKITIIITVNLGNSINKVKLEGLVFKINLGYNIVEINVKTTMIKVEDYMFETKQVMF